MRVYVMSIRYMRMRVRLRPMNVRMRMSSAWRYRAFVYWIMVIVPGTMCVAVRMTRLHDRAHGHAVRTDATTRRWSSTSLPLPATR